MSRALLVLLALAPASACAQVGRSFTAVESYVALSESVRVGKISKLEGIEYDKPLTELQSVAKPYRLTFDTQETIRGKPAEKVELVLALQDSRYLEYMRRHGSELLLTGGPNRIEGDPSPEIGVEEDGRRVDLYWYQFRFLEAPTRADQQKEPGLVKQIQTTYNDAKMFGIDLSVVNGREAILRRARAFAKKHHEMLLSVWMRVPNAFGQLVGYSNAFCGITLPVCPETERTLVAILKNPGLILNRIPAQERWVKESVLVEALKGLKPFPSKANAELIHKFLGHYEPPAEPNEGHGASPESVQRVAWDLLKEWNFLRGR
jgi:hypothetical protein